MSATTESDLSVVEKDARGVYHASGAFPGGRLLLWAQDDDGRIVGLRTCQPEEYEDTLDELEDHLNAVEQGRARPESAPRLDGEGGSDESLLRDGIFELPLRIPGGGRPRVAVDEDGVVQAVVAVGDDRDSEAVDVFMSGLTGSATKEES